LEEADLYRFLEAEGHPVVASEFRAQLRAIDLDCDRNISFIEYCLWQYKKTVEQLVVPPGEADPVLLRLLDEALAEYQKVVDVRKARDVKMAQLNAIVQGGGVKGNIAKAELDQMLASDNLARNKAELTAAAKRRAAQKAVEGDKDGAAARARAMAEEEKKLQAEKKKKEDEERRIQEEKRAKLKAKSAMFEQVATANAPPPAAKGAAPAKRVVTGAKPVGTSVTAKPTPVAQPVAGGAKAAAAMFQGKIEAATPVEPARRKSASKQEPAHQTPVAVLAPVPEPPPTEQVWHVRALYPYTANSETELSFQAGDDITIHHKDPGGWWEGELGSGARGWLPMNYVQEI